MGFPGEEIVPMLFVGKVYVKPYSITSSNALCLCVETNQGGGVILLEGEQHKDEEKFERLAKNLNLWHEQKPDPNVKFVYDYAR